MQNSIGRRQFLATTAAGLLLPAAARGTNAPSNEERVAFFLVGDTHYLADSQRNKQLDVRSAAVTRRLIEVLNKLPGTAIPQVAGGGAVVEPQGVIHAGDCIDTGDKANLTMQRTEWVSFVEGFGLTGKDGTLRFPVYEVHGNHDSPCGDGLAVKEIIQRNKDRPGLKGLSDNGVHYSWDWGPVHFVNLGIVVGEVAEVMRPRRYAPLGSLQFLIEDLRERVGTSGRPVIVTHHIDVLRYAQPLPVEDRRAKSMEWDPADVQAYYEALRGYNIAALLYGHTHGRNVFHWDGSATRAEEGIPAFNVDNSSHFAGTQQAFFYFELDANRLTVREYQTTDAWETGSWAPQTWSGPMPLKTRS